MVTLSTLGVIGLLESAVSFMLPKEEDNLGLMELGSPPTEVFMFLKAVNHSLKFIGKKLSV